MVSVVAALKRRLSVALRLSARLLFGLLSIVVILVGSNSISRFDENAAILLGGTNAI
jgi:hypothetical protein